MIFIRHPFNSNIKMLDIDNFSVKADVLRDTIGKCFGYEEFILLYNGKKLCGTEVIPDSSTVHIVLSLPGGKGGFGSMLRAIGAQIEKTTNREACRDLSGRRLRDINEEQRLKKWIAKKAEREAEKIRRRKERLERLKRKPTHKFFDYEYEKEMSQLPERVNDAVTEGLQKFEENRKRQCEDAGPSKGKKLWLDEEFFSTSSDSDSAEMSSSDNSNSAKKLKTESAESSGCYSDISNASQSQPSSSKEGLHLDSEESLPCKSDCESTKIKAQNNEKEKNSSYSEQMDTDLYEDKCSNDQASLVPLPSSSKVDFNSKDSLTAVSDCKTADVKSYHKQNKENNNDSDKIDINLPEIEDKTSNDQPEVFKNGESNLEQENNKTAESTADKKQVNESVTPANSVVEIKKPEEYSPINLCDFQDVSEIEALGLDRLKTELMSRGLKCGGTLLDRAQRLWIVRGLQPNEYPAKLQAKNKK